MILSPDIPKETFIKRIPFLKTFKDNSSSKAIGFYAESFNENVKMMFNDDVLIFKHVNYFVDLTYMREKINDNYFFHFTLKFDIVFSKPEKMDDITFRVLLMATKQQEKNFSLHKEIMNKQEHPSIEQLNEVFNEINKKLFEIESFIENNSLDIKNPLQENNRKSIILEALRSMAEDITIPQDYSKEFNQTGSGKPIQGKQNIIKASPSDLRNAKARMAQAHLFNKAYKQAFTTGQPDENGIIHFKAEFQGRRWDCQIPPQFKNKTNIGERSVDYKYYFDYPDLGDGAMQVAVDKTGYAQAKNLRSKPDMNTNPNLSQAADAGYSKDFQGSVKYLDVKAGVLGKEGKGRYSVLPTPAMDAAVKVNIAFQTEILDFMQGGGDYTNDNKGKEISNSADFDMKIKKVKKDAEAIINRPLTGNQTWETFKKNLLDTINTPEEKENLDVDTATRTFIKHYKQQKQIQKPEISMSQNDLDDFEKRQAMLRDRLAAARNRKK